MSKSIAARASRASSELPAFVGRFVEEKLLEVVDARVFRSR
jgi:hypothetical protein